MRTGWERRRRRFRGRGSSTGIGGRGLGGINRSARIGGLLRAQRRGFSGLGARQWEIRLIGGQAFHAAGLVLTSATPTAAAKGPIILRTTIPHEERT